MGTQLRVLSKSYCIQWIPRWQGLDGFKSILVPWKNVASALEGLTHLFLRVQEIVVWIYDTFDNNLRIKYELTKYLKESR